MNKVYFGGEPFAEIEQPNWLDTLKQLREDDWIGTAIINFLGNEDPRCINFYWSDEDIGWHFRWPIRITKWEISLRWPFYKVNARNNP